MVITTSIQVWETTPTDPSARSAPILWSQDDSYHPSYSDTDGWLSLIRSKVYSHREVEAVYVSLNVTEERLLDYWIIIPHRDVEVIRQLIRAQHRDLIRLFAQTANPPFQLDFHIIYAEGRDAQGLVPTDAVYVPNF